MEPLNIGVLKSSGHFLCPSIERMIKICSLLDQLDLCQLQLSLQIAFIVVRSH